MTDRKRLNWELRKMKELINNDPQVRARFDQDGHGIIDGEEWEQVRQLVIQRIERETAEKAAAEQLKAEDGEAPQGPTEEVIGLVAQEIYDTDLQASTTGPPTGIGEAHELILEQEGGGEQLPEVRCRHRYSILARDGSSLGSVRPLENGRIQNLTDSESLSMPDLSFRLTTSSGEIYTFTHPRDFRPDCVEVLDPGGRSIGFVSWTLALQKRNYIVASMLDCGKLAVQSQSLRPFTLDILAEDGRNVGTIVRGWSGLGGFLTGGNRMRIQTDPERVTPGQRWGLLAAALLADLAHENRNRDRKGFPGRFGG